MKLEYYTERSRELIETARKFAQSARHQQLTPEHLLKVLLDDKDGTVHQLLKECGGDPSVALKVIEKTLGKFPLVEGAGADQIYPARELLQLFEQSEKLAADAGDKFVTIERILLALLLTKGTVAAKAISDSGVTVQDLNKAINKLRLGGTADSLNAEEQYDTLKKFTRDLTLAAREGK